MRPMPSTQASPTHGDFLGRTQGAIERSGSRDDSLAKVEVLLLQNIQNTQPGTAKNIIEEKHTKYKVLFCNECHYLCSPPFGLHKQIFSTTAGCHPLPLPLPTMLNSCCGSWDVLGLATYSGHAVIFVLPLSAPLSLHLLLPGARCIIHSFHCAPCHSPKRSSDALASPHPPTVFLFSCSAVSHLGRICM